MHILDKRDYCKVKPLVTEIPINTLFAQVVLENKVQGKVYVDNPQNPSACLIFHPYGMLLLCGKTDNTDFNLKIQEFMLNTHYPNNLWLQVYPGEWSIQIQSWLGTRLKKYPWVPDASQSGFSQAEEEFKLLNRHSVVECTRFNFTFNRNKYQALPPQPVPAEFKIVRVDKELFHKIPGTVVPRSFWDSNEDFVQSGVGFCLIRDQKPISTCSTAFVIGKHFEIGIETDTAYRGRGYASLAARAFIDYCLINGLEPVWACRKENLGSYKLAQHLGFEVKCELPYYGLVNNYSNIVLLSSGMK